MNAKKTLSFITGSGVGALVAFLIIVTQYPASVSPGISLSTVIAGMIVFGALFGAKVRRDFLSSPASYLSGLGAVFLVMVLSFWAQELPGIALLLVVAVSALPVYSFRPISLMDAFLSGPEYFGGAITGLAIVGTIGLLTPDNAFGATFVGMIGALVVEGIAVLLAMASRKPHQEKRGGQY
ncbi:MAG: hypothetical protein PWQ79_995 [Thermococcaceae archaeon]|nr:hypothetical protein [Thermococcaceae archaeon]